MKQSIKLFLGGMLMLAVPLMLTSCEGMFDDIFGEWSRPTQNTSNSSNPEKKAATISYATSSVSKTFGDADFINDLTNTGDGTVTYSSSDPAVATVNAATGLVSIKGNGTATITATVTDGEKFTYATKTATYTLGVGTAAMTVTATGYTGTYDGAAHGITVTVAAPDGATVKYGTAAGSYTLSASPTYTDAGSYTVYYQVTKEGYTTISDSKTVEIAKAAATISFAESSVSKTFGNDPFTNKLTNTGDGAVTYESSNKAVAEVDASTGLVTIKGNGDATIKATVTDGTNYTYATKSVSFALGVGTATLSVTAKGYNDVYDGAAHGITVTATSGATIKYGTTEGNYDKTSSPTYTDVGTYKVYYQVTKTGFTTVTGSETVIINEASMSVSASGYSKPYDGNAHGITVTVTSPSGTTIMYGTTEGVYDLTSSPTYTDAGTKTVYYQVTKDNYKTVTGSATVEISKIAGSISFTTTEITKKYGEAAFKNEATKTGDGTVSYSSNATAVAEVNSSTGEVTIKGAGTAIITATVSDAKNYEYSPNYAQYTLTVKPTSGVQNYNNGGTQTW